MLMHLQEESSPAEPRAKRAETASTADEGREAFSLYLQDIGRYPLLDAEQERTLAESARGGDARARERMIQSNLRLVVRIAHDYARYGVPLLDLISEGNIGLMKAAERFDPSRGVKFATYAAWWIKQCIKRALSNQGKTIRLPVHLSEKTARIRKAAETLRKELGREPTNEEVAKRTGFPLSKVVHLKLMRLPTASLEAQVGREGNTLGALLADESTETPRDAALAGALRENLKRHLSLLSEREREILRLRFGLDETPPLTLEKVGDALNITRERVRQIEGEALLKLRAGFERDNRSRTAEEIRTERRQRARADVVRAFADTLASRKRKADRAALCVAAATA